MSKREVTEERKRLEDLLDRAGLPKHQKDTLAPVIENLAWQRIKLNEAREEMQDASIVCEYNNGGNPPQTGIRENPIFKGYINLWRAYMVGLEKYTSYLPKDLQGEATGDGLTTLDQVKQMRKVSA